MKQSLNDFMSKLMLLKGGWYWLGCFGRIGTEALWAEKSRQTGLGAWYIQHADAKAKGLGKRTTDCNGVAKFCHWVLPDGSVPYDSTTDLNEYQLFEKAKSDGCKWGAIATIPRARKGLVVTYTGHMGIYLGDGTVLEARGGSYGVVITQLDGRGWQYWYENPFVDYAEGSDELINFGEISENVREIQKSLMFLGFSVGSAGADAEFGSGTKGGINAFKKSVGLPENGLLDTVTYIALIKAVRSKMQVTDPQLAILTSEKNALSSQLSSANVTINSYATEKQFLETKIFNNGTLIDSLTKQRDLLTISLSNLKSEKAVVDGLLVNKSTENTVLNTANAKLTQEKAVLSIEIEKSKIAISEIQEKLNLAMIEKANLLDQIKVLTDNLDTANDEITSKDILIATLKDAKISLNAEILRLKAGFSDMTIGDIIGAIIVKIKEAWNKN